MRMRPLAARIGIIAAASLAACAVHDTMPPLLGYGGYGSMPAQMSVAEPTPYSVESMPPDPLYEQMTPSPGPGWVWIDGYWHWDGAEWVWVPGRWEHQQDGYVYVQPDYDYATDHYVYTPGYWSLPQRVPRGWAVIRDHRTGRPPTATPPIHQGGVVVVTPVRPRAPASTVGIPQPPGTGTTGGGVPRPPRSRPVYVPVTPRSPVSEPTLRGPVRGPVVSEPAPVQEPIYAPPAPTAAPPGQGPTVIYLPGPSAPSGPPPRVTGHPGPVQGRPAPVQGPTVMVPAPGEPAHEAPVHEAPAHPARPTTPTTAKHH